jgi:2-polyprenyl-3-methyl-5-hydroxy-6-metoxy-1,4-benzoquinol methylase
MKSNFTSTETPLESKKQSGAETYSSAIGEAINYTRWILDEASPYVGLRVLEVGLGHGSYRTALPSGITYFGVDIDEDSVSEARIKYPSDTLIQSDISDASFTQAATGFAVDTILCVNVLEHILDHEKAFQNLIQVLQPGGHLFLFVPAFEALYTDLDRLAGHHRRYHKEDIAPLLPDGAKIIVNKYFNPIGGLGWWFNGLFRHNSLNSGAVNGQITLFDKYVLPLSRTCDLITKPFFGQSLICVVKKA